MHLSSFFSKNLAVDQFMSSFNLSQLISKCQCFLSYCLFAFWLFDLWKTTSMDLSGSFFQSNPYISIEHWQQYWAANCFMRKRERVKFVSSHTIYSFPILRRADVERQWSLRYVKASGLQRKQGLEKTYTTSRPSTFDALISFNSLCCA